VEPDLGSSGCAGKNEGVVLCRFPAQTRAWCDMESGPGIECVWCHCACLSWFDLTVSGRRPPCLYLFRPPANPSPHSRGQIRASPPGSMRLRQSVFAVPSCQMARGGCGSVVSWTLSWARCGKPRQLTFWQRVCLLGCVIVFRLSWVCLILQELCGLCDTELKVSRNDTLNDRQVLGNTGAYVRGTPYAPPQSSSPIPLAVTSSIRSGNDSAPLFSITLARWISTVR
jgi:hypothetical protein